MIDSLIITCMIQLKPLTLQRDNKHIDNIILNHQM